MLTKKDIKILKETYIECRECGHQLLDFDDDNHDMKTIAEILGYDTWYDDNEELHIEEEQYVREALNYYRDLCGC